MAANQFSADDATDEEKLDRALEDSFPASDPPSSGPITGTGPSPVYGSMDDGMDSNSSRGKLVAIGAGIAGALVLVAMLVRRKRHKPGRIEMLKHTARDATSAAAAKAKDRAHPLTDRLAA